MPESVNVSPLFLTSEPAPVSDAALVPLSIVKVWPEAMSTVPELFKVVIVELVVRFTSPEPSSVVIVAAPVRLVIPVPVKVVIVEVPVTLVVPEPVSVLNVTALA